MKYNPPFGSADPNAAFVDRNTPAATSGSRVPAAAVEHPQREIMAVIAAAGLTPSGEDLTQLLQAINNLIAAATGGAGDPNYVLMTQARARLPIYPEVLTSDGRLPITSPSTGQVRVPAGYDFLHRGIYTVTTVQTDFATAASKTYHLRWAPSGGFALKDLADVAYNPGGLDEGNVAFDTAYDDMLVARVVTNPSNVPTVTNLQNRATLRIKSDVAGSPDLSSPIGENSAKFDFILAVNFARTPDYFYSVIVQLTDGPSQVTDRDIAWAGLTETRYQFSGKVTDDCLTALKLRIVGIS